MLNGKRISMVAAMAMNRVIGAANDIPWKAPGEQRRFRELTEGHLVVMGRRTYESIGRPLPGRDNLVLTRDRRWWASGVIVVHSVEQALAQAGANELVAIGGAQIYRLLMPFARRIYLTHVHADVPGDTFFPDFDPTQWDDVECRMHPADEEHAYPVTFVTLERRNAPEAPRHH